MIHTITKLEKDGKFTVSYVDSERIQKYIDEVKESLTPKYFELERECNLASINSSHYQEYFCRNVMKIPFSLLEKQYIGVLEDYQYYEDVYFDNNFAVHRNILAHVKQDWEFRYIVENNKEKLPLPLMIMVKKFIMNGNNG